MDPFRKGVDLYLGATNGKLCTVKALIPYLTLQSDLNTPTVRSSFSRMDVHSLAKAQPHFEYVTVKTWI